MLKIGKFHFTLTRAIALGIAAIALIGALLLWLPAASRDGQHLPFVDALFTAVSASCVTGLVVRDTWSQFTLFGQIVILALIQVGGLGFMSISIFFSILLGKKIGLGQRSLLMESINSMQIGGVVKLIRRVLIGTAVIELGGAALLSIRFIPLFGWGKGLYYSLFHSVSAFCNAGFDLMGCLEPYSSLTSFRADALVNIVIMALVIVGGIGFLVWNDIAENKWHFSRYLLHTKVVLVTSAALIVLPALLFLLLERGHTMASLPVGVRWLSAFFQSVTLRTAGFNTLDFAAMAPASQLLCLLLMAIGASPGSTGGGLKTTTTAVIVAFVFAYIRNRKDIVLFKKRVEESLIHRAFVCTAIFLLLSLGGIFVLLAAQQFPLVDAAFEVVSAAGTVGLTTGITRELHLLPRLTVMLLMYGGRVGTLTLAMALAERPSAANLRYPAGKMTIG